MTGLSQDVRYAFRSLLKRPAFSAIVIAVLAVCIGANTAIFSVVDAVLLKPLPYRNASRLISISEELPVVMTGLIPVSVPDYLEILREDKLLSDAGIYRDQQFELSGVAQPQRIQATRISASLFPMLGINPVLGRNFTQAEDMAANRVVLLGSALWRDHYGADPRIIGKQITLDRNTYTVLGVMPPGFVFPPPTTRFNNEPAALYVPISFTKAELQGFGNMYNNSVVARLRPGVAVAQANVELKGVAHRLVTTIYPADVRKVIGQFGISAMPLHEAFFGDTRPMLLVLLGSVLLVLLIACADVAGLALTRSAGRQREISIRIALGASRPQLIRQVLVESLLLALIGAGFGLLLCAWAGGFITHLAGSNLTASTSVHLNGTVLLFTIAVSLATAVLFGLAPAFRASQVDVSTGVKEGGRSQTPGRKQTRTLDLLVTAQFALALLLLIAAGLLMRSFHNLLSSSPGFQPENIVRMDVSLPASAYPHAGQIRAFFDRLDTAVQTFPGVKRAGLATSLPLGIAEHRSFFIDGQRSESMVHSTAQIWVMGEFFHAMGIPLLRGRYLGDGDVAHSMPVAVINQALAREFWPNQNPLGQRIRWGDKDPWMTVVGVVGNVKDQGLNESAPVPETYTPWRQLKDDDIVNPMDNEMRKMTIVLRTPNAASAIAPGIERFIHNLDPSLPVTDVTTMEAHMADSVRSQRFQTVLLGCFAIAALILAALGIGGVLAYSVAQRVTEIGIRMALGATGKSVLVLILLRGIKLAGAGIVLGFIGALLSVPVLRHLLYETSPHDFLTFSVAPLFLLAVALLAVLVPAQRAAAVDPIESLRVE